MCSRLWLSRADFLNDPSLELNGYQADFDNLEDGLFYFTHQVAGCFSTLAVKSGSFLDLYTGRRHTERKTGTEVCPGYCLHKEQLERCDAPCECAYVREVVQYIRDRRLK